MQKHAPRKLVHRTSVQYELYMNFDFGFWILYYELWLSVPNFRFGYWVFMMYILFFLSTVLISNNTQQLLNFNENPNPRRQTEILSSMTNTWTSIIKIFFVPITILFFKNIYCACDMKVKIIVAKCKLLTLVFLLLCI